MSLQGKFKFLKITYTLIMFFLLVACGGVTNKKVTNSSDTVLDKNTKLTWMDSSKVETMSKTFSNAQKYCNELKLDGHNDWRLPTIRELFTITDVRKYEPSISNIFKHNSALSYWSSDSYAIDNNLIIGMNFYDGSDGLALKTTVQHIRCVRGDPLPKVSVNKRDKNTVSADGHIWQDSSNIKDNFLTYEEAKAYCNELVLSGIKNWRLPSVKELRSIVDRTTFNPAINQNFSYSTNGFFWSSTPYIGNNDQVWTIFFRDGNDYHQSKNDRAYVRCIK